MPLQNATVPTAVQTEEGLLLSPIGPRGRWAALRDLRSAMHRLRQAGGDPVLHYVVALSKDGRIVSGRSPEVALFALGYGPGNERIIE
jgi:hypothetical protein